jgi:hypothetical protein
MNTKLIAAALIAGLALPAAAQAHVTRGELRHDVRQVREERRDVKEERREHDWRGVREERRELNRAKGELRRDSKRFHRQHSH